MELQDRLITQPLGLPSGISPRRKKGLLIAPEFPYDSFWSYRHIMSWVGRRAALPPLGLLTFAAYMQEHWDFDLVDLNVRRPSTRSLRRDIAEADAVFVGAMSIQKRSLVDLLSGPARGLDTPWVLGGPFASSYRDQILNPQTESDSVLHDGIDHLVWGEAYNWISTLNALLEAQPRHSDERPTLLIPEAVAQAPPGSRRYLVDRSLFSPLESVSSPRWDLVDMRDYRRSMIQTTAGCPFRCDFCDIIQFNGGFSRPKTPGGVQQDLEAIHATGYRGGVFTVDDNFIGDPKSIGGILDVMTEFQRAHDYPFSFSTQASVNIGAPALEHLIVKMRQAGFSAVFLGIENPDEKALRGMNKKQNATVDIPETVRKIQAAGIEVYAGFIFGGDEDTPATAEQITEFVKNTAIHSAMAGLLTPVPHTPLHQRLQQEGRLLPAEYSGNNTDDEIQFRPAKMTLGEMRDGIHYILESLFAPAEAYRRARDVVERVRPHIFASQELEPSYLKAALVSIWKQGIARADREYFNLLRHAYAMDRQRAREAETELREMALLGVAYQHHDPIVLPEAQIPRMRVVLDQAHEYLIRRAPNLSLPQIADIAGRACDFVRSGTFPAKEFHNLYGAAVNFLQEKIQRHRFPGAHLTHAFELAVKGMHYELVAQSIVSRT